MFGFLNPRPHTAAYRRIYARLCQHQHRQYGLWSLAFHSYEAVFLYQCAVDAGAVDASSLPNVRCCRLLTRSLPHNAPDTEVGRFCASVALLLASVKLEDDLRDTRGLLARVARWTLRRRIQQANHYFTRLDPRFTRNIAQLLQDHQRLEESGTPISLPSYVEPTELSFGYVFGLMAKLPGLESHRETFITLGRKLGAAIIAYDCAVDWKRDRRRGEFNPLPDEEAVAAALEMSAEQLAVASDLARQSFGARSQAAHTLETVEERIRKLRPLTETTCPTHRTTPLQVLRRTARQTLGAAKFLFVPARVSDEPMNPQPPFDENLGGPLLPGQDPNQQGPAPVAGQGGTSRSSSGGGCSNSCGPGDCGGCDVSGCDGCGDCGGCDCNC